MQCSACRSPARAGAAYCAHCGAPLPASQPEPLGQFPMPSGNPPGAQGPPPQGPPSQSPPPTHPSARSRPGGRHASVRYAWLSVALVVVIAVVAGAWAVFGRGGSAHHVNDAGSVSSLQTSAAPDASATSTDTGSASPTAVSSAAPSIPTPPPEPIDVPGLPSTGVPVPVGHRPHLPAPGSTAVPYTDSATTPSNTAQVVEWQPPHLPPAQQQAVDALVSFALDVNAQNFFAAWNASTARYDTRPGALSAFRTGYSTTRFYQLGIGQPTSLASDLVAVPLRFVSRQNGAAQGDASIPPCEFWPQFVYLVGKRDGQWLPGYLAAYTNRPGVSALERVGDDGQMQLNPSSQKSTC